MEFSAATVWRRAAEPGPMMMAEEEAQQQREPASRSRRLHKRMESLGREKECVSVGIQEFFNFFDHYAS